MTGKTATLADRLDRFFRLQDLRKREPDPFQILNVKRTEAPYTHFIGWLLDPHASHPWSREFLIEILKQAKQPLPPQGRIEFFIESFSFEKSPEIDGGFTDPDIFAIAPDRKSPTWCMIVSLGASNLEVAALKTIFEWGEKNGICEFQASATSSFVIKIPTSDADVL